MCLKALPAGLGQLMVAEGHRVHQRLSSAGKWDVRVAGGRENGFCFSNEERISEKTADTQVPGKQGIIYKNTLVNKDPATLSNVLMLKGNRY